MLNFFRNLFIKKPVVIDSNDLLKHKHALSVNPSGKLVTCSAEFYGEVVSLVEWDFTDKEERNIPTDVTILDMKVSIKN